MKKHIILAALCAAVLAAPFANAKSGFSGGASKPSGFSSKPAVASKPNYGASFGSSGMKAKAPAPVPAPAPAAPAAPAKSGFASQMSPGAKAAVVGAAGGTAVGGALYAAHANQAAVAAYENSKKPVETPTTTSSNAGRGTMANTDTRPAVQTAGAGMSDYHAPAQPQVIVVQQSHSSDNGMLAGVIGYELGRHSAHRDAQTYPRDYGQAVQPVPATVGPVNTYHGSTSNGGGFAVFIIVLVILAMFGLCWYLMFRRSDVANSRQVAAPSSKTTYTL